MAPAGFFFIESQILHIRDVFGYYLNRAVSNYLLSGKCCIFLNF